MQSLRQCFRLLHQPERESNKRAGTRARKQAGKTGRKTARKTENSVAGILRFRFCAPLAGIFFRASIVPFLIETQQRKNPRRIRKNPRQIRAKSTAKSTALFTPLFRPLSAPPARKNPRPPARKNPRPPARKNPRPNSDQVAAAAVKIHAARRLLPCRPRTVQCCAPASRLPACSACLTHAPSSGLRAVHS